MKTSNQTYNPLYFLASLGAGGLAVTFFMYPTYMIEHPDTPMVTFAHIWPLLTGDDPVTAALLRLDMIAIAVLALVHIRLLVWNINTYRRFRHTDAYKQLKSSNAEVSLMAIPLTLAMSINVMFILGAVFVPGLWNYVEYLFPFAIAAFLAVGVYALKILGEYFARLFISGDFDFVENNNLTQMLAIFALVMVAVGLAAPGAMSHIPVVNAIGIGLSVFFLSIAILLGLVKFVLGFQSILHHGLSEAASPSLWIVIPILTLVGITIIRMSYGLHHGFDQPLNTPGLFVLTTAILSIQLVFGLIGYLVMKRLGYFRDYLHGDKSNAGSYSLVCPGVAFFVFGMFFITFGLVKTGLIEHLGMAYYVFLTPLIYIQVKAIGTLFVLNQRIFGNRLTPGGLCMHCEA
jgi:hypothetical protein